MILAVAALWMIYVPVARSDSQLRPWQQCGGCGRPGGANCADSAWGICPPGFECVTANAWYYQVR